MPLVVSQPRTDRICSQDESLQGVGLKPQQRRNIASQLDSRPGDEKSQADAAEEDGQEQQAGIEGHRNSWSN
jgi:hypothetical protein